MKGLELDVGVVVNKAEACQIFTSLSTVTRGTLAHIVTRSRYIHTDSMFAVVLLAGAGLGVHLSYHWLNLTELSSKFRWAFTGVLVDPVHTAASILTHVVFTLVHIRRAVLTAESL